MHKYNKFCMIMIMLLMLFCAYTVQADTPQIENEPVFNSAAEAMINGRFSADPVNIIKYILKMLTREIHDSAAPLISMICIGCVSSLISSFDMFGSSGGVRAAFFACFTAVCSCALNSYLNALRYASGVIHSMTEMITKFSPVLTVMLLSSGHSVSAGAFHPVLASAVYIMSLAVNKWFIPLITLEALLGSLGSINETVSVSGFCRLIHSLVKWMLAAVFTVFTGICSVYGFTAPSLDALGAKAIKFAVGSLVPVVGGFLSESMETVVGSGQMMKNAAGGAGLVCICSICSVPVIKLIVICIMLKLGAAVTELISDKKAASVLWSISGSVTQLLGMVIVTAVLFMICISIMLSATGSVI